MASVNNKLSHYLSDAPGLRALAVRLEHIRDIQRLYRSITPGYLSNSSRIGDVNDNTIFIIAFNGTAAARLKQQLPSLLARIQEHEPEISAVRVEVQIEKLYTAPQQEAGRNLSSAAVSSLQQLAHDLRESPLQRAICFLAARGKLDQDPLSQEPKESNSGENGVNRTK